MSASSDPIAEIKARLDIVTVVSRKVALKKTGRTFKGLCPFHQEKTASFIVFPDKGNYHCFGCGANGDIFSFLMKTENLEFTDALQTLAAQAGVVIKSRAADDHATARRAQLGRVLEEAAIYFQQALRHPSAGVARGYLAERGFASPTIDQFRIGWAPDRWDGLSKYLTERGFRAEDIREAGLAAERDDGGSYDRFRGRVIFPIYSERDELVGFGGRILGDGHPKYLNSPQTELFDKGAILFGINHAKSAIRSQDRVVVVEGYVDVLIAHQSGIREVVASLGTALTERQVNLLKRLTRTVVLALDADSAGDDAVLRGLEVARQVFGDATVAVPLPQGLVRLESRLDADIRIAALPRGKDPDEIIREGRERWEAIVDAAKPVVDYYFEVVLGKADLSSTKSTAAAVRQILPIIGEIRDPVQQSLYLQRLADRVRIAEQLLASELARWRLTARSSVPPSAASESPEPKRRAVLDEYAIGLLLLYPAQARSFLSELTEDDWALVESRQVFCEIRDHYGKTGQVDRDAILAALPEPIADWLRAVLLREAERPTLNERAVSREQEKSIANLRRFRLHQRIPNVPLLAEDLSEEGPSDTIRDVNRRIERDLAQLMAEEGRSGQARIWTNQ